MDDTRWYHYTVGSYLLPIIAAEKINPFPDGERMRIENTLTASDIQRAEALPSVSGELAESLLVGLGAYDKFVRKLVNPIIETLTLKSDRETVLIGLHYRIQGLIGTMLEVTGAQHFQSISSASRSAIELYLDMELLHRNSISDGVARLLAHTDAQKLSAARKTIAFYDQHPQFTRPLTWMREFAAKEETRIDANTIKWWKDKKGAMRLPQHWTDRDVKARAARLGVDFERMVADGYDLRNWLVHSGLSGVVGLSQAALVVLSELALGTIHNIAVGSLRILGAELRLDAVIENFEGSMTQLKVFPGFVLLDNRLRAMGEPQRVMLRLGLT